MIGLRLRALRYLHWNYTWKGVWVWLKGRQRCPDCNGTSFAMKDGGRPTFCGRCKELAHQPRGYQRILSEPEQVLAEQTALAEGVFA